MSLNRISALITLLAVAFVAICALTVIVLSSSSVPAEKTAFETSIPVTSSRALLPSAPDKDFATSQSPRPAEQVPAASPPASPAPKLGPLSVKGVYNPPPLEGPHAAEITRIEDLSTTYDAREVPALAVFLNHDAPEVRAAAIDGLIRLGSKEAAEPLRVAAAKIKDPREAVAMLDAAAYLELSPMPASMRSKVKAAKTAGKVPADASSSSSALSAHEKATGENGG
jgi:hypothetical protein